MSSLSRVGMIFAADVKCGGMGFQQKLPWKIQSDIRHFQERTRGAHLVAGPVTAAGLPPSLQARVRVVHRAESPMDVVAELRMKGAAAIYVVGGSAVFDGWLPYVDHIYATWVKVARGVYDTFTFSRDDLLRLLPQRKKHATVQLVTPMGVHGPCDQYPTEIELITLSRETCT